VKYGYRFTLAVTAGIFSRSWPLRKAEAAHMARAQRKKRRHHKTRRGFPWSEPGGFRPNLQACEDFYHYVNGGWIAHNPTPAAYPSWAA